MSKEQGENKGKKKVIIGILIALAAVLIVVAVALVYKKQTAAKPMSICKIEGDVSVLDIEGNTQKVSSNMNLEDTVCISTDEYSYAWVLLDEHKFIKMDEQSTMMLFKNGKSYDVVLVSGNLFFDVTKKLESDEALRFYSGDYCSNITGTSGIIGIDEKGNTSFKLLDGSSDIRKNPGFTFNPETGEFEREPKSNLSGKLNIIIEGEKQFKSKDYQNQVDSAAVAVKLKAGNVVEAKANATVTDLEVRKISADDVTPFVLAEVYQQSLNKNVNNLYSLDLSWNGKDISIGIPRENDLAILIGNDGTIQTGIVAKESQKESWEQLLEREQDNKSKAKEGIEEDLSEAQWRAEASGAPREGSSSSGDISSPSSDGGNVPEESMQASNPQAAFWQELQKKYAAGEIVIPTGPMELPEPDPMPEPTPE